MVSSSSRGATSLRQPAFAIAPADDHVLADVRYGGEPDAALAEWAVEVPFGHDADTGEDGLGHAGLLYMLRM